MIRYFIDNAVAVTVLSLTIILFGILALLGLPIQLTPDVQTPAITVSTFYPGATPQDVEQDIIVEQEQFLRSVPGLKKMTSTANLGSAEIILEFGVGSDMGENLLRVNNALAQVPSYPENVDEPSLSTSSSSDQPVAWFSVRSRPGHELDVDVNNEFYSAQVIANAKVLAEELLRAGYPIVSGGTDNHLMLVDVFARGVTGKQAEHALDAAGITVNKNMIPFDPRKPLDPSGIRIGTPALTTRGMKEPEMKRVAAWITEVLAAPDDAAVAGRVRAGVHELCEQYPAPAEAA